MNILKTCLTISFTTAILFAAPAKDKGKEQTLDNILGSMSESSLEGRTTDSTVSVPTQVRAMSGYDEALSLTFEEHNREPIETEKSIDSKIAFDVEGYQDELNKLKQQKIEEVQAAAEEAYRAEHEVKFVSGYCILDKDILVERIATYAYLDCDFTNPIGRGKLAVSMVPEFYAKALVANPLYIVTSDNRYPVHNGVVMTKDRNSVNLANIVNDRLIQKIAISGGYRTLGIVAQQAQAYLNAKSEARTQTTSTVTGGDNPVVVQDTKVLQPKSEDYFAVAVLQSVSELAKIVGENMIENLPYTFKANKGAIYYVDLELTGANNMEGYKIREPNIIKTEPSFLNGKQTMPPKEIVPVLNGVQGSSVNSGSNTNIAPQTRYNNTTPSSATTRRTSTIYSPVQGK